MACRGSVLVLALAVPLLTGCRYAITNIEVGSPLSGERFEEIRVGHSTRTEVLAELGPPERIRYTIHQEILEYRAARHGGTDIEFMVPTSLLSFGALMNLVRGISSNVVGRVVPTLGEPAEFSKPWFFYLVESLFGRVFSSSSPVSLAGEQTLEMHGRSLRTSVIQVVLDREQNVVAEKSFLDDFGEPGLLKRSLLQE